MHSINKRLEELRKNMKNHSIDAIIIPSSDPHQSEYVSSHWQERKWISGFDGSSGTVAVTMDHAGLWTDSRYFLQGELQLKGTDVTLHKMTNQFSSPWVDFLVDNLAEGSTVAINGMMFSKAGVDAIKKSFSTSGIKLSYRNDLISDVWLDRPSLSDAAVEIHDVTFAGKDISQKLKDIRSEMQTKGADLHMMTALDEVAWTFNIRGSDVEYNPVVIAYAIIGKEKAHFFINKQKISPKLNLLFSKNQVEIHDYDSIIGFLNALDENNKILVDPNICNQTLYEAINATILHGESIPKHLKAIKNETEIKHIRSVMKKDGAAIAETFYWMEEELNANKSITEVTFAEKLANNRSKQKYYHGESFGAIIGYKENGAIIHYHPESETCKTIEANGILLVDSGGQYSDGTTDITRTVSLGNTTADQKKHYTLILKGMIALTHAKFPIGTMGVQLDTFARQFLWSNGLNFGHGTGHGVGFFLNVHESPQGFAPGLSERGKTVHKAGMLTSNEPGYYVEGQYGMRIENLVLTTQSESAGFLEFETVTLYPFDHILLDKTLLTKEEIQWINQYHKKVYAGIAPFLKGEVKTWFKEKCRRV